MDGFLYAILSGTLFGTLGYFGVRLQELGFGVAEFLCLRFFLAAMICAGVSAYLRKSLRPTKASLSLFVIAAFFYAIPTALYFIAANVMGTGLTMVLFFCYPIAIVLITWLVEKKKPTFLTLLSIGTVMMGLLMLLDHQDFHGSLLGILIGVFASTLFGIYLYTSKHFTEKLSIWPCTFWVCFGNFFSFFIVLLLTDKETIHWNSQVTMNLSGITLFGTILPIFLLFKSLEKIRAEKVALLTVFEPMTSIFIGCMALGESISYLQAGGVFIILASVALIQQDKETKITPNSL